MIVEVLDARDPLGCRCYEMEKTILDAGAKKIVLLINKIGEYLFQVITLLALLSYYPARSVLYHRNVFNELAQ